MSVPHTLITRGLHRGYACAVSKKEFIAFDPSREQLAALFGEQQAFTAALILRMDGGVVTSHRDLNSYCDQFAVEGDPADKVEPTE